jgi:aminoglycoside/choline kinase family phosphotransferase
MHDAAARLFQRRFGAPPASASSLAADGSQRAMSRLHGPRGERAIAVRGPDPDENRAFLSYSRSFRSIGLPVPEVYGEDEAAGVYLVEDLGDVTLFRALGEARAADPSPFPAAMWPVYRRVLETLPRFQVDGGRAVDWSVARPRAAFDRPSMRWDLDYFKYHFLKLAHVRFDEDRLERDFERLVAFLLEADATHFLYRDFQSRNVMLRGGEPWFLDYQGGRRGALAYDAASLLYDAKAAIPEAVREALLEHYLGALSERVAVDREAFRTHYRGFVVIRILQAMGAYGYRGFYERKAHFLKSVPYAVGNLERLLGDGLLPIDVPELRAVLERIVATPSLRGTSSPTPSGLVVRIGSFSYRHGLPQDPSDHGGGFVFDCRAIENPGLDARYASLSGLDEEVARFLEARDDADAFLGHAQAMVEAQVRAYLARGWTSLDVRFGCTGGRHRSVWCAERLAAALAERFPAATFVVEHRERSRWPAPDAPLLAALPPTLPPRAEPGAPAEPVPARVRVRA